MGLAEAFAAYQEASQNVLDVWRSGQPHADGLMQKTFQLDYMPEPYLDFGSGGEFCVFLTTNPGGGMSIQLRDGMRRLYPDGLPSDYADVAKVMARYYLESGELKGAA